MEPRINEAFTAAPRSNFLPPEVVNQADLNIALPIGFGQTNSQPETLYRMLEWLDVQPGDTVLDVGSGSGWSSALLAHLTGRKGQVIAVEAVPELVESGRENCAHLGINNVQFREAGDDLGWPAGAPYDRVLVSANADELPSELLDQLKPGGRMVVPVRQTIIVIAKNANGDLNQSEHPGFVFVPLVRRHTVK